MERREGFTGREETEEEMADEKNIRDVAAKERKAAVSKPVAHQLVSSRLSSYLCLKSCSPFC